jgi:signal transduction histidine kinase
MKENIKQSIFKVLLISISCFLFSVLITLVINQLIYQNYQKKVSYKYTLALLEKDILSLNKYASESYNLFGKKISINPIDQNSQFSDLFKIQNYCIYTRQFDLQHLGQTVGYINTCYDQRIIYSDILFNTNFYLCFLFLMNLVVVYGFFNRQITELEIMSLITQLEADNTLISSFNNSSKNRLFSLLKKIIIEKHLLALNSEIEKVKFQSQNELVELASSVAHDIRSPLSSINLVAYKLKSAEPEVFNIIKDSTDRIDSIAADLLKLRKKIQIPDLNNNDQKVNFTDLINQIIKSISNVDNIEINLNGFDHDLYIVGSFDKLYRVFTNLIHNSVEALTNKIDSRINMSAKITGKFLEVILKDNGPGFPEEVLNLIGKIKVTAGKQNGNGIGLYTAHNYISSIGGNLEISNTQDGALIKIYFLMAKSI